MSLNYRELRRRYELDGADQTVQHLSEALQAGDLQPEDFSLRTWPKRSSPMVVIGCGCWTHALAAQ